jgi:SAM-dependent methyltransferase
VFSEKDAAQALRRYRQKGPDPTTRILIDAIEREGIAGRTVLDIGGGIGTIQLELLAAGAASTDSVDASPPYVAIARREAARRGLTEQATHRDGDFVTLAEAVPAADVVTLDRMVCCYDDLPALLGRSIEHARRMIGLVYPRDAGWLRAFATVMNTVERLFRRPLRWYIHPERTIDGMLRQAGFERRFLRRNLLWQVALYVRPEARVAT